MSKLQEYMGQDLQWETWVIHRSLLKLVEKFTCAIHKANSSALPDSCSSLCFLLLQKKVQYWQPCHLQMFTFWVVTMKAGREAKRKSLYISGSAPKMFHCFFLLFGLVCCFCFLSGLFLWSISGTLNCYWDEWKVIEDVPEVCFLIRSDWILLIKVTTLSRTVCG